MEIKPAKKGDYSELGVLKQQVAKMAFSVKNPVRDWGIKLEKGAEGEI